MTPVTAEEAAVEVRVRRSTIRQWVARGYLRPLGRLNGRDYFDLSAVRLAERDRHRTGKRPRHTRR